jgi:hypothetical protein
MSVKDGKGSDSVNMAPFAKRSLYWRILKRPKNPVYPKSGELGENRTITFFPGPYRAPIGFFYVGEKNQG